MLGRSDVRMGIGLHVIVLGGDAAEDGEEAKQDYNDAADNVEPASPCGS